MPGRKAIPAVVRHLASLPRELVHQVLSDLSIYKILSLALHAVPYINESILSHLQLGQLFSTPAHLSDACSYFQLYTDIYYNRVPRWRLSIIWSPDEERSFYDPRRRSYQYDALIDFQRNYIVSALNDANTRIPLLSAFLPTPLPQFSIDNCKLFTYADLERHWTSLRQAHDAINNSKSSQLRRLADLMELRPFMLKTSTDPSQERRPNVAHIVTHLRQVADRVVRTPVIQRKVVGRHVFITSPLVPYDRYLRLFLKIVKRYPPEELCKVGLSDHRKSKLGIEHPDGEGSGGGQQFGSVAGIHTDGIVNSSTISHSAKLMVADVADICRMVHHPYPETVAQKIVTVVKGMAYVYTSVHPQSLTHTRPRILRTMHTPYSAAPHRHVGGLHQPMFVQRRLDNDDGDFEPLPLCEKELEWLTAFLDVCDFLSRMEDAKWTSRQSVAEMWKRMMD